MTFCDIASSLISQMFSNTVNVLLLPPYKLVGHKVENVKKLGWAVLCDGLMHYISQEFELSPETGVGHIASVGSI